MPMFSTRREVVRYALIKSLHNSLPFFAVLAAVGTVFSLPVLFLLLQIGTGLAVDLTFFYAIDRRPPSVRS